MFLGVSGSVLDVQMTPSQRKAFGLLLVSVRKSRFGDNRQSAYTEAGVNSSTWKRAEEGQTLKEQSLNKIVTALFPRTEGDWRALLDDKGNFRLNYWDRNGLKPEEAGDLERVLGITEWGRDRDVDDLDSANRELSSIRTRIEQLSYRIRKVEEHLDLDPFEDWRIEESDAPRDPEVGNYFLVVDEQDSAHGNVEPVAERPRAPRFPGEVIFESLDDDLAADGDEVSISTEQEEPDTP